MHSSSDFVDLFFLDFFFPGLLKIMMIFVAKMGCGAKQCQIVLQNMFDDKLRVFSIASTKICHFCRWWFYGGFFFPTRTCRQCNRNTHRYSQCTSWECATIAPAAASYFVFFSLHGVCPRTRATLHRSATAVLLQLSLSWYLTMMLCEQRNGNGDDAFAVSRMAGYQ